MIKLKKGENEFIINIKYHIDLNQCRITVYSNDFLDSDFLDSLLFIKNKEVFEEGVLFTNNFFYKYYILENVNIDYKFDEVKYLQIFNKEIISELLMTTKMDEYILLDNLNDEGTLNKRNEKTKHIFITPLEDTGENIEKSFSLIDFTNNLSIKLFKNNILIGNIKYKNYTFRNNNLLKVYKKED